MAPQESRYREGKHPISVVSRLTGLSPHVIRVWERRYSAVTPSRTPTNRRLYSDADIDRLRMLHTASAGGHNISQLAALPHEELEELAAVTKQLESPRPSVVPAPEPGGGGRTVEDYRERCEAAVKGLNGPALEAALLEAGMGLSQPALLEDLLGPFMVWVGDSWHDGTIRVAHEHLATVVVRHYLTNLWASNRAAPNAPAIVIATLPGQLHEIGAQLAAAVASSHGWNVVYLGASLPADEIANAVNETRACAVGISIVYPSDDPFLVREMYALRRCLPENIALLVGGSGARRYHAVIEDTRATALADLDGLRRELARLRDSFAEDQIARETKAQRDANAS